MKRRFLIPLLASALCVPFLSAQRTPPTPAEMVARRVAHLTQLLTLTNAQQAQATTIFTEAEALLAPLRTTTQTARAALQAAVKTNDTGTINTQAAQIGSLSGQSLAIQTRAEAAFYLILTADQKTAYAANSGPGGGRGRGFGRGFGGPPPGAN